MKPIYLPEYIRQSQENVRRNRLRFRRRVSNFLWNAGAFLLIASVVLGGGATLIWIVWTLWTILV